MEEFSAINITTVVFVQPNAVCTYLRGDFEWSLSDIDFFHVVWFKGRHQ